MVKTLPYKASGNDGLAAGQLARLGAGEREEERSQLIGLLKWGKHSWVGLWFIQIWWIAHKGGVRFKVTLALAQQASRVVAERLGV